MQPAAETSALGARVEIKNLTKRFGSVVAVDDTSLSIEPGQFVTFLGPSGSGKTTTLNAISGFADVDEGEILLDGASILSLPPHKRNIGVVFQHYALFPHMTAADNVAFPLRRRRLPKAQVREKVRGALELVHLADYGERLPRELSGGQQQRVALARALVFEPRLLLMDEPLAALDRRLRDAMQIEIKRIQEQLGITVIYVTHDQDEAMTMSDVVAIFNEGRIAQVGSSDDLYERPADLFVARFMGESNRLPVTTSGDGEVAFASNGASLRLRARGAAEAGRGGMLVVRPENVRVNRERDPDLDSSLTGRIGRVRYFGAYCVTEVLLDDDLIVRSRQPVEVALEAVEGERAHVQWDSRHALFLRSADGDQLSGSASSFLDASDGGAEPAAHA
ncbi:ABC transporter ATP-binding protein [Conexibacter sp. JD483]|uniref:ABC transporter ATP-binding protein n=1 Tax=unclassified Conexibacter TaxID=2627773 RepID=UPI00272816E3|nr:MULTISPECIES: ABC transporter ATP-binding protein [unclassified Conexibacter]MDO8187654.1 ABC transporter ATP-binding protein [Conexibacter sp. CPCC 205706]MDO8199839.1 ABC transporter ATP-binding protein [Conexibacter sp. CPCC 205762]MDR9370216.1 ABC transporter ATP-binding protein [Conexibacter sp. JD483]